MTATLWGWIYFSAVSVGLVIVLLLKTQWFKFHLGRIMMLLAFSMAYTGLYNVARRTVLIEQISPEIGALVISLSVGTVLLIQLIYTLHRNWHYWAWTKKEES